jgi:anti-sigma regulatory factor (Ser/Thr protein kinase)
MKYSLAMPVTDASHVGEARRITARFTADIGLPEPERGQAALVITELGNNLARYAQDGQLVIRALREQPNGGIEILSLDSGPGFPDVASRLADGYSSGGTPGIGLGAVRRLSQQFDVYSGPGVGTAVMSRVVPVGRRRAKAASDGAEPATAERLSFGAVCVRFPGEDQCGDAWGVYQDPTRAVFMLVDGLGHGSIAAEAADEAVRVFDADHDKPAAEILARAHLALRSTRGAVMAVAETDIDTGGVSFVGVGNISACLIDDGRPRHMVSVNGTVGFVAKPKAYAYTWQKNALMALSSDGMHARWRLERFPDLLDRHPSIIAGVLYQNYARGSAGDAQSRERDDVTILVARWTKS